MSKKYGLFDEMHSNSLLDNVRVPTEEELAQAKHHFLSSVALADWTDEEIKEAHSMLFGEAV